VMAIMREVNRPHAHDLFMIINMDSFSFSLVEEWRIQ
jgi:hypothetical protein